MGSGQFLSSVNSGDGANGLVVQVTAPGITSNTAIGNVTYAPGFGQGLAHIATSALLAPNGVIPVTIAGLQGTLAQVGSEISMQQQLVATQQAALTSEFTNMETTLVALAVRELLPQPGLRWRLDLLEFLGRPRLSSNSSSTSSASGG